MHTYQRAKPDGEDGSARWQTGIISPGPTSEDILRPLGPVWEKEAEAAAYANFLNGGQWSPGALESVLPEPADVVAAREVKRQADERRSMERPKGMDYPPEDTKQPAKAPAKAPAHAAKRKPEVKRSKHSKR